MEKRIDPLAAEDSFRAKLREAGLVTPDGIDASGKIVRIDVEGKRNGNKNGWYCYHGDGIPAGAFGAWSDQPSDAEGWQTWCAFDVKELSQDEYLEHKRRLDHARAARTEEDRKRKQEAKDRAKAIWDTANPCEGDDHAYLRRKGVKSYGLREHGGSIVIPLRDRDGEINSLEFIDADGAKLFLSGGRKAGCWFGMGEANGTICVAEGYATAASIHEATGYYTAVAFDCGNLAAVAKALRDLHPTAKIIVCADDDQKTKGNPGQTAAGKAAKEAGALVAIPDMPTGGDFNDQHALKGLESVAETISDVLKADSGPIDAADLFPMVMEEIQGRKEGKVKASVKFGIESVDKVTGGMRRGYLSVIGGLPGAGKTAAALGTIIYNASHGVPCLLFSIEMDRIDIGVRCLSQNSGVKAFDIFDENVKLADARLRWSDLMTANGRLEKLLLTVDDQPVTISEIVERSHHWMATKVRARGYQMGLIAIDYLGLISSEEGSANRNREVAQMCQALKARVAKALRTPVLLLSQLTREAAKAAKEGEEPETYHLRDSGEIEAAADLIIFPFPWPRVEDDKTHELVMVEAKEGARAVDKWIVRKCKNGAKNVAPVVMWHPETMQYTGLDRFSQELPRSNWQDGRDDE